MNEIPKYLVAIVIVMWYTGLKEVLPHVKIRELAWVAERGR